MKSAKGNSFPLLNAVAMAALALGLQRCGGTPPPPVIPVQPTAVMVTETSLPQTDSHPMGIIRGPDNNLWFTDTSGNRIGRRAADGSVAEFTLPNANSGPAAMVVGPDGKLWFTEMDGGRIGTITTDGATIREFPLASGDEPAGLTLGPDGVIWFADIVAGGDRIGRVTPEGVIGGIPTPTASAMPTGIVKTRDGSLFFIETSANKIARIPASNIGPVSAAPASVQAATVASATAAGGITEYQIPTADAGAAAMAVGSDGNLWFTETTADKIGKFDVTTGMVTEFALPTSNARAGGIAAGPDCNLWFAENNANLIGRVTTGGAITEFKPSAGSDPTGITAGADGNMWYTEANPGKLATFAVQSQTCLDNNLPPVAKCQQTTVDTDPGVCSAASASINDESFDPDGDMVSTVQSPAGNFSLGNTSATLTVTDAGGDVSSCDGQVTVLDKQPPTISCGAPVVECTSPAGAAVTLSPTASDNCPGTLTPTCSPALGAFPLGATSFSCTVSDASGNAGSCSSTVTVRDTTPPVIGSVTANPPTIWPPNHKMVPVSVTVAATDVCDPAPGCVITGVTSNEAITTADWNLTGALGVKLAATRLGSGSGRIYMIAVRCTDAAGNAAMSSVNVTVPVDARQVKFFDDTGY